MIHDSSQIHLQCLCVILSDVQHVMLCSQNLSWSCVRLTETTLEKVSKHQ